MFAAYVLVIGFGLFVAVGCSALPVQRASDATPRQLTSGEPATTRPRDTPYRAVAVRYQVADVGRAVEFYTTKLGFELTQPAAPAFAMVSSGNLTLWLSGPTSSGARPMPDGTRQQPGGWNRIVLEVADLPARVDALKKAGFRFRNNLETGPGGSQIQLQDPDGNPIELFEPAK
jgi:glyoxylase I family protein